MDKTMFEALEDVTTLICHRHSPGRPCADGTAAAILLHDAIPNARVIFASHGEEVDAIRPEPGMLFCDVTPSAKVAPGFVAEGAIVLDHHETAQAVVSSFGERGVFARSLRQSGATLAYLHAWLPLSFPGPPNSSDDEEEVQRAHRFAQLAATRDTFDEASSHWLAGCEQAEALALHTWDTLSNIRHPFGSGWSELCDVLECGKPLYARRLAVAVATARSGIRVASAKGTEILLVNTLDTSDVERLAEGRVVVGFSYLEIGGMPRVRYSLRSKTYDVGALCAAFGGGGHRAAAGFSADLGIGDPVDRFLSLIDGYETTQ